jgi:hypothetical protein
MPDPDVVRTRQHEAMTRVRDVIERHAPETAAELRNFTPDSVTPNFSKAPDATILYLAEALAALAKTVDQQVEANRPRRRGRPRKQEAS